MKVRNIFNYLLLTLLMFSFMSVLEAAETQPDGEKIKICGFAFDRQDVYESSILDKLVQYAVGRELTFQELQQVADSITNYYHEQGYFLAKAYLPRQAASDGIIKIGILPGKYGDIRIQNHSWLPAKTVAVMLGSIRKGNIIRRQELERTVLILHDIPGIKVDATLQPGRELGTADIIITIDQDKKQSGSLAFDNYGYSFTGKYQSGIAGMWNHMLADRDMLSFNVLTSGKLLSSGSLMYQTAVGNEGKMVLTYSNMKYHLGGEYEVLGISGQSKGVEAAFHYPLMRSYHKNIYGSFGYFQRQIMEKWDSFAMQSHKSIHGVQTGLYGSSKFDNGTEHTYSLHVTIGNLVGAAGSGQYAKENAAITRRQALSAKTYLTFAASGQLANKSLDSSEKMIVGGVTGVRAYSQGEVSGDEGYVLTGEVHRVFARKHSAWELIGFMDYGMAQNRGEEERRNLSGAGVGISFLQGSNFLVRADYAWKLRYAGEPAVNKGQFWIRSTSYF